MNDDVKAVLQDCTSASNEERVTFPEVVAALAAVGVERYHTDLVRGETTYYLPGGESERVPGKPATRHPAAAFSAAGVADAVRAIQAGTIRYREFCERVMQAGCVGWMTFLAGKRVVYYGRTGDSHVEWFPGAR
ncbi:DUF1398 family protein [Azospirillum rugosum]|uniref:Uncharacterized protein YbcV (DUF1398 family) n=1 Tax=Azospirillum rugosum TaxID=416170 RepID=A0ABS4SXB8_9PROT|nr:DUF1398 family protein [Azospirillum rugosum]MBP2297191.1 uncharacterized protein YbcV (DUF1398 family) [Azospirillum rugosum]MDQ0531043.1 uncharacterized protein YbcV (DUF1398 family) [Azospirillum rugosum]